MIELNVVQGSQQWHDARLGVVTASQLSRIITPARFELSKQRASYISQLLAEWALGYSEERDLSGVSPWIERGKELEGEARDAIRIVLDEEPRSVGLCYRDESKSVACSPDALIGEDGGAEIKCPMAKTHLEYLLAGGVPTTYWPQVQGSMWITRRPCWVFASYHPDLPPHIVRVDPDPQFHDALDRYVPAFVAELEAAKQQLIEMGFSRPEWAEGENE